MDKVLSFRRPDLPETPTTTGIFRDRPRFFDQVGHQTTNASIGNKHFFTK